MTPYPQQSPPGLRKPLADPQRRNPHHSPVLPQALGDPPRRQRGLRKPLADLQRALRADRLWAPLHQALLGDHQWPLQEPGHQSSLLVVHR